MFISNAIYKSVPAVLPVPIAEGTIVTINGLQVGDGDAAYGIVPQTVSAIPATGRIQVAVAGMIDLTSDANKAVSFTEDDMKALGADFNFVPGEEHSGGGGGGNDSGIIDRTITECTNDEVETIGQYAFAYCVSLSAASFANVTEIWASAFYSCGNLETITAPKVESISEYAFAGCSKLKSVSFPEYSASTIPPRAFSGCSELTDAYVPGVTVIDFYAFHGCSKLAEASFPDALYAYSNAFYNCKSLATVNMPKVATVGSYAFGNCTSLSYLYLPKAQGISASAFNGCTGLQTASLPEITINAGIYSSAFYNCNSLESLYLLNSAVGKLSSYTVFQNTPLSNSTYLGHYGSIFVRESLLSTWKAATNWSAYNARFVGLTDQQIEALG